MRAVGKLSFCSAWIVASFTNKNDLRRLDMKGEEFVAELLADLVQEIEPRDWEGGRWMVSDLGALDGDDLAVWDREWPGVRREWFQIGPNAVMFHDDDKIAYVRYESWSEEPPQAEREWNRSWSGEIYLRTGRIQLSHYFPGEDEFETFDLGRPGATWHVRVLQREPQNVPKIEYPGFVHMVGVYKLQFWGPVLPGEIPES
ncbi:hypothetical protein [Streptosporangium sp. CA-115845]|uniref:hypothetical protein n=1 Tax=Streptosporangium sp. CA-115845 TaxID=3240071 RepID=UPI003D93B88C